MSEYDAAELPMPPSASLDSSRRGVLTNLLGLAGGAFAFSACTAVGRSNFEDKNTGAIADALKQASSVISLDQIGNLPVTSGVGQNLRGTVGTAGQVAIVTGFWKNGDGGGGVFCWDTSGSNNTDNRGLFIVPNTNAGANAVGNGWRRLYSGALNVTWFGARADGGDPSNTRVAIQAVVDLAAAPGAGGAGVVYFPANVPNVINEPSHKGEYTIDAPIVLPRKPFYAYLVFRGDGQNVSQITAPAGGFIADQNVSNTSSGIRYLFEHLTISVDGDARAFDWTIPGASWSQPELHFNHMFFSGGGHPQAGRTGSTVDGLVRITNGLRCRFYECTFAGFDSSGTSGVALWFDNCIGTTLIGCRNTNVGNILRVAGGSGFSAIACRSEGAIGRPAWDFSGATNITLIDISNESYKQAPAQFRFTNCSHGIVLNPDISPIKCPEVSPNCPIDQVTPIADGFLFANCAGFQVIGGGLLNSFIGAGVPAGTPRMFRIDALCRGIKVLGTHTNANVYTSLGGVSSSPDVDCAARDCEVHMQAGVEGRWVGTMPPVWVPAANSSYGVFSYGTPIGSAAAGKLPTTPSVGGFLFSDASDGKLKFKDATGTIRSVTLTPAA